MPAHAEACLKVYENLAGWAGVVILGGLDSSNRVRTFQYVSLPVDGVRFADLSGQV